MNTIQEIFRRYAPEYLNLISIATTFPKTTAKPSRP
jgi:hypothetical protein